MTEIRHNEFVFPGNKANRPLSKTALMAVLKRMGRTADTTVHGFRSTFRDWAAEQTSFPAEIAESALAHQVGDAVERAYRRSDLFARRGQLMAAWSRFCAERSARPGDVVSIRAAQ